MTVPPPPPPHGWTVPAPMPPGEIVRFAAGPVSCDGTVVAGRIEAPLATTVRRYGVSANASEPEEFTLTFSIDAAGRPVGIRRGPTKLTGYYVDASDLGPSLATSRFAAGAPRSNCSIGYRTVAKRIEDASRDDLYEVASSPVPGVASTEVWDRLQSDGDCSRGPGKPRQLNYPAFERLAQPAGTRSWTFLRFDVDNRGRTRNVDVVGSSGNRDLDAAGRNALQSNRYAPKHAVHGCAWHFHRTGEGPIPAPPMPIDAPGDTGDEPSCSIDPKSAPALFNGNAYPTAFLTRHVEGWAIIGYDTAPWGQIGNVRVLSSEPDAAFGMAAMNGIGSAHVAESETGRRGCVRHIRFRMPTASTGPPD